MKRFLLSVATAAIVAGSVSASADEIRIGVATAQTGSLAYSDQPSLAGLKLAVEEINARGGAGGKFPVVLDVKDTRSDTGAAVQAAQEHVANGVTVIITPCDADPSIAAGQIAQAAETPAISSCGSTPTITTAVGNYMFGNYPADNAQGTVLADLAIERGYKTAYLMVSPDSAYTLKLPEYFGSVFEKKGGKVVGQGSYVLGSQDFSAEVAKIKALDSQPDVIMTAAYEPEFPAFMKALRAAGVTAPVFGSDGIDSPTTLTLGTTAEGVVHTTAGFADEDSKLAEFNAKFEQKTGTKPDTVYYATGYEIGLVLDAAVARAGSADRKAIRDALASLEGVKGVTGRITYAGTERFPVREIALVEIKGEARQLVKRSMPNPADVPAP